MALIKVFRLLGPSRTPFVLTWQGGPAPVRGPLVRGPLVTYPSRRRPRHPLPRESGHLFALLRRTNWGEPMALIKVFRLLGQSRTPLCWPDGEGAPW